ncbi:MAG: hypothetical protein WCB48_07710 [Casimicrobiaceae bacterium]
MKRAATLSIVAVVVATIAVAASHRAWAAGSGSDQAEPAPKLSGSITGFYYAMRDQPDFGVGVASIDRGPLHLEARYNYEAKNSTSAFLGWTFSGGGELSYEITPIAGMLFGQTRGVVPGAEASAAYRQFDAYVEAEYVSDLDHHADSYVYAWSELGWRPVDWLRIGLVGQRTRVIHGDRDLQRGVFAQLSFGPATLSLYAFNPDLGSRYGIISLGVDF